MEQRYVLGIVALAIVAVLGIGMVSAFGFGNGFGFMKSDLTDEEKAQFQEQRGIMQKAIENKDYAAWKSLMEQEIAKMQAQITEENFNKIVEQNQQMTELRAAMQEAKESGDYSKVQELQTEFGIKGKGFGKAMKAGFRIGKGNCSSAE